VFKEFKEKIEYLFFEVDESIVTWIEIDSKGAKNAVSIYAQPIQVSDFLADDFFAKKQSAILTSATLTVKESFSYIIETVGLTDFYRKQVKLFIPK
jgi:ATP-dependent DNA helicase DinG